MLGSEPPSQKEFEKNYANLQENLDLNTNRQYKIRLKIRHKVYFTKKIVDSSGGRQEKFSPINLTLPSPEDRWISARF